MNSPFATVRETLRQQWLQFWMGYAGLSVYGRIATRIAAWCAPPHKARMFLAYMNVHGYVDPGATIYHSGLRLGANIFIADRVIIFERRNGGPVELGDRVCIYRDTIIETGYGGYLTMGADSSIHPRCQLNAYLAPIEIGSGVMIAPNCSLYSYNHGIARGTEIRKQPLTTKGAIVIGDEAWLGVGSTVLSGVTIGKGSVIGAGAVVTRDVPDGAIVAGVPARLIKRRCQVRPELCTKL